MSKWCALICHDHYEDEDNNDDYSDDVDGGDIDDYIDDIFCIMIILTILVT